MRLLLSTLIVMIGLSAAQADIQDPPAKKYGKTRKFSRGISNIVYGFAEIPDRIATVNEEEGNAAAASYGVISGVRRTLERFGIGVYEVVTSPAPLNKGSYKPYLKSPTRNQHGTYTEFPPELGF